MDSKRMVFALFACLLLLVAKPTEAAVSCGSVASNLFGCLSYLQRTSGSPSQGCCNGINSLYQATRSSRDDRIAACRCMVTNANSFGNLDQTRIGDVASKCGVFLGYTPSASTNCDTIP